MSTTANPAAAPDLSEAVTVHRRTFEAANHPSGSPERARLNGDPITSEYLTGKPYVVRVPALMSDGTRNPVQPWHFHTFKTKRDAESYADEVAIRVGNLRARATAKP